MVTIKDIYNKRADKDNIFPPSISSDTSIDILRDYLLGEDWVTPLPVGRGQCNMIVVEEILKKYSKRYRDEVR